MTTTFKDIELLLDSNHIPYNLVTLGWVLKNLTTKTLMFYTQFFDTSR